MKCSALALVLGKSVSFPGTAPYDSSLASYWSLQEAELHPACIVTPSDRGEVALAIKRLSIGSKAFPGRCNFAVRSGGHTAWAGAANIEAGIVIDMQKLNQVNVSADKTMVEVGPGNRFVCDAVDNFEVVLASGQTVNANAESNSDLWRALRGGSNNFGIVTAFTMRSFTQPDYWGGSIISDSSHIDELFQAFESFTGNPDYDPYATNILNLIWQPATDSWMTLQSPSYTKSQANPPVLRNFSSVPSLVNTMRISNSTDFANELYSAPGQRELMTTATFQNRLSMLRAIHAIELQTVLALRNVSGLQWSLALQPQPAIMFKASAKAGGNSLGLDESDGNIFNVLLTVTWVDKRDDLLVESQTRSMFERFEAEAKRLGVTNQYLYLNYAASWQDPISGYGDNNKAFLQETSLPAIPGYVSSALTKYIDVTPVNENPHNVHLITEAFHRSINQCTHLDIQCTVLPSNYQVPQATPIRPITDLPVASSIVPSALSDAPIPPVNTNTPTPHQSLATMAGEPVDHFRERIKREQRSWSSGTAAASGSQAGNKDQDNGVDKGEDEGNDIIKIRLRENSRFQRETAWVFKRTETMWAHLQNYTNSIHATFDNLRFVTHDGSRINRTDTPESVRDKFNPMNQIFHIQYVY
ncbi:oxidoreductase [Apiospora aurea]|uniref:Oxidoreductase n=1 Tax=Apiospora aurea TaxID=335848 RepID=A0ABR1QQP5_9PEZI